MQNGKVENKKNMKDENRITDWWIKKKKTMKADTLYN